MFVAAVPELVMNTFPLHFKNRIKTTNSLDCTTLPKKVSLGRSLSCETKFRCAPFYFELSGA